MTDPLRLIGQAGGVRPIGPLVGPRGGTEADAPGSSFKNVLMDNIKEVNKLQEEATTAIEDLQTGQRTDVEGVLLATQKADTAFHMLVALSNKVAAAYEEVKQLRV